MKYRTREYTIYVSKRHGGWILRNGCRAVCNGELRNIWELPHSLRQATLVLSDKPTAEAVRLTKPDIAMLNVNGRAKLVYPWLCNRVSAFNCKAVYAWIEYEVTP